MGDGYDSLGFYHDPDDPRVFVPKRNPAMGWTLNLSRAGGRIALAALLAAVLGAGAAGLIMTALRVGRV